MLTLKMNYMILDIGLKDLPIHLIRKKKLVIDFIWQPQNKIPYTQNNGNTCNSTLKQFLVLYDQLCTQFSVTNHLLKLLMKKA